MSMPKSERELDLLDSENLITCNNVCGIEPGEFFEIGTTLKVNDRDKMVSLCTHPDAPNRGKTGRRILWRPDILDCRICTRKTEGMKPTDTVSPQ